MSDFEEYRIARLLDRVNTLTRELNEARERLALLERKIKELIDVAEHPERVR